jgi:Flp pilus assembly protein TadG
MFRRHRQGQRRGATLVEAAIVYPVALLLILGVIVVGLGMFRYNQVAELAREGARWASVRGAQYSADTGNAPASSTDIRNYVESLATGLDPNSLTVTTTWNTSNALTHTSANNSTVKNTVSVTVSYPWVPEAFFGGATLTMQSTSVMTMNY